MISKAEGMDKQAVYKIWKNAFAQDDGGYTDFYFSRYYRDQDTFVAKNKDEVIGCCSKHPHEVMLHGRMIRCSMIVGMAVKPNWRHKGVMHQLMDVILDEIDHQELITMIQAYQPKLYEPFGFETVYTRRNWTIRKSEVKRIKHEVSVPTAKDCLILYGQFVSRFNGYVIRDLAYFETWFKEIEAEHGKLIAVYKEKKIQGYAAIYVENGRLEIRECLYLNSNALLQMVNYALTIHPEVVLQVSGSENLSKVFPHSKMEEIGYTMVRLNNPELFNRLYNCNVKTVKEAMCLNKEPLYMHENH